MAFFNCGPGNLSPFSPLALPTLSFNYWHTAFYHWRHDSCLEQSAESFSDRSVAPLDDPMLGASTAIAFVEEISGLSTHRFQRVFGWISSDLCSIYHIEFFGRVTRKSVGFAAFVREPASVLRHV